MTIQGPRLLQLNNAITFALKHRPPAGGFPFLAEVLRQAGVLRNHWELPSCQALYLTTQGPVITQSTPLISGIGMVEVPAFNQEKLIQALRNDQAGNTTFPEFLTSAWQAGVVHYEVDFITRTVSYYGATQEVYVESYPACEVVTPFI